MNHTGSVRCDILPKCASFRLPPRPTDCIVWRAKSPYYSLSKPPDGVYLDLGRQGFSCELPGLCCFYLRLRPWQRDKLHRPRRLQIHPEVRKIPLYVQEM